MSSIKRDIIETIIILVGFAIATVCVICEKNTEKKYGKEKYEIVVTDAVVDKGFGGKTKYHISYKYRIVNRPNIDTNMQWQNLTTTIDCFRYKELETNRHFYQYGTHLIY